LEYPNIVFDTGLILLTYMKSLFEFYSHLFVDEYILMMYHIDT